MKKSAPFLVVMIGCLLTACAFSNNKKSRNLAALEPLLKEQKKIAFCRCLNLVLPVPDSILREDGSLAMYVQMGSTSIEFIDSINDFTVSYLKKEKMKSSTNSTLAIAKCVEMYESDSLMFFLRTLNELHEKSNK